ncbi:hypothetical protein K402DRAFT_109476 [Aulographum hederae CBS 113979]|uniref:Uncharacterized protein n=1 Tax=Aulographum hederae CBS 113979 TaxID=1176131 RepID=A0A6G1GWX2_9PEZI|nr:hypothetical protein K402DRAFT_109476 [Aulographum hederae CBS 113979]
MKTIRFLIGTLAVPSLALASPASSLDQVPTPLSKLLYLRQFSNSSSTTTIQSSSTSSAAPLPTSSSDSDIPIGAFPFPIPPPGFPPPSPGTPNPTHLCSSDLGDCADCAGVAGWCIIGLDAGCPCEDKCDPDNKPSCSSQICSGGDDDKCTVGPQKDCECEPKECPVEDEQPSCSDEGCAGNDENQCSTVRRMRIDHGMAWKECS